MMLDKTLFQYYDEIKEKTLTHQRFNQNDILPLIEKRNTQLFLIKKIGESYESRNIFLLKAGNGKKKIAIWSQMHGNEPTGTQVIFDILNFFETPGHFSEIVEEMLSHCTIFFVPMLNPDGAERFQRRNAQDIDINRDALQLAAPESNILEHLINEINPDFGFNLHDQDIWYSAGNSEFPATISLLTPSYNQEKEINESRSKSMKLIVTLYKELSKLIPNQIAKYNDDYMPTAFGDQIQKKGVSTVLIESGGYKNDTEKQFVRRLNFLGLIHAFKEISSETFNNEDIEQYNKIPFNIKNKLFDYIVRNVNIMGKNGYFITDIGIRRRSLTTGDQFFIDDIGDLSLHYAYNENSEGLTLPPLKTGDSADDLIKKYFQ